MVRLTMNKGPYLNSGQYRDCPVCGSQLLLVRASVLKPPSGAAAQDYWRHGYRVACKPVETENDRGADLRMPEV